MANDLVGRVKAILTSPKTEWPVIAAEPATVSSIFTGYILILAAIPVVIGFISMSLIGVTIPFGGTYRVGIMVGITNALATYILSLVGVFVIALVVDALAPTFGGTKNQVQALKAIAYSYTAFWVASIGQLVPFLGVLIMLVGLIYGIYLLYLGLPVTMKSPSDKALPYTALVIVCAIVIAIVMGAIAARITGMGAMGMMGGMGGNTTAETEFDPDSPLGQLETWANQMEAAGQNLEAAQQSGDPQAQQDALGQMFGTVLGGSGDVEALAVDEIRNFVPATLAGLPRTEISAERNAMMGLEIAQATARYDNGSGTALDLEIMDLGGTMGLMALAGWANIEQESQTATGYERTYRDDGRVMHEIWDNQTMHGEFAVIVKNRFLVQVTGNAPSMDMLKASVASVDLAALERL